MQKFTLENYTKYIHYKILNKFSCKIEFKNIVQLKESSSDEIDECGL